MGVMGGGGAVGGTPNGLWINDECAAFLGGSASGLLK